MQIQKYFTDLVSLPSPSGHEEKVRNYILGKTKKLVDDVFIDGVGNVYLRKIGHGKKSLLLCAHMDTVEPTAAITPVMRGGVFYSDGKHILGADNKVGVAAMLSLLMSLREKDHPTLEMLFSVREETDGGIRFFPKEKIQSKEALLIDLSEPIGMAVVGAPYVGGYGVTVVGHGSHVRNYTKDSIHPLGYLQDFIQYVPYGRKSEDTIVNIAIIKMGDSYNSIPDSIYFTGEIRTFRSKEYKKFFPFITQVTNVLDKKHGTTSKLEIFPFCEGYSLTKTDTKIFQRVCRKLAITPSLSRTFAVGDFSVLNEWGIKTLNIGNGSVHPHTVRECVSRTDLILLDRLLKTYIAQYSFTINTR